MERVIGRIERALRSSERRLRVEEGPRAAALWIHDPTADPELRSFPECREGPAPGGLKELLLDPAATLEAMPTHARERLAQVFRGEPDAPDAGDLLMVRADGSHAWIEATAFSLDSATGSPVTATVVRDVSHRHAWHDQVTALHEELPRLVLEVVFAREHERRQLAQDLHDTIGQALALARIRLDSLARRRCGPEMQSELMATRDLVKEAQRFVAAKSFDLSPPVLHDLGLAAALEWLAEDMAARHGLEVRCRVSGVPPAMDRRADILLFRAVRELLINVVKHARADAAEVELRCGGDAVEIVVADDGTGFDPCLLDAGPREGFGLFSMRERLAHLGGALDIESSQSGGTRIRIRVPRPSTAERVAT